VAIAGELPPPHKPIAFDPDLVRRLGGISVPDETIAAILTRLGFVVERHQPWQVVPPSWRHDIDGPADLVEEVIRIHGLETVAAMPLPRQSAVARPVLSNAQRRVRTARRAIAARGFNEAVSFSFIAREKAALFGGGDDVRQLANPIAADLDALRPSLLPSLLAAAGRNAARGVGDMQLFEIGPTFQSGVPGAQVTVAAGIRAGDPPRHWEKGAADSGLFAVKADMLAALEAITGAPMTAPITQGAAPWYHPGRSGMVALGKSVIAQFGELHPNVLAAFDLKGPAASFEIFLDAIPAAKAKGKAKPLFAPSPFQAIERDFAFVVDAKVAAGEIVKAARLADRALIEAVTVFDLYEGTGVPDGHKSVAIAVRLQPRDKTLTDAEIDAVAQKIVEAVTKATGAALRS
jgi:phenylalanyl-tRNA synthetase beta chain